MSSTNNQTGPFGNRFTIRASASRLDKGLLAIPQKFKDWFPAEKARIEVAFDDDEEIRALTFHPHDPVVKENRIFGLKSWFSKRNVREGDIISITVEDKSKLRYRIALDRYVQEQQERRARQRLQAAATEPEAEEELTTLLRVTKKRPRTLAHEELLRISKQSARQPRPSVYLGAAQRNESVPSAIRVLLRQLHGGKCQLCSFTFEKRNGEPYFEIHHLDPKIGHHPSNLLVVCPNCHAQLEHAELADFRWAGIWLVGLSINGKHISIRQPLAHDSAKTTLLALVLLLATSPPRQLGGPSMNFTRQQLRDKSAFSTGAPTRIAARQASSSAGSLGTSKAQNSITSLFLN